MRLQDLNETEFRERWNACRSQSGAFVAGERVSPAAIEISGHSAPAELNAMLVLPHIVLWSELVQSADPNLSSDDVAAFVERDVHEHGPVAVAAYLAVLAGYTKSAVVASGKRWKWVSTQGVRHEGATLVIEGQCSVFSGS